MAESSTGNNSSTDSEKDVCPLCLDPVPPVSWQRDDRQRNLCCGSLICHECVMGLVGRCRKAVGQRDVDESLIEELNTLLSTDRCPTCRTPMPVGDEENFAMLHSTMKQHPDWVWPLYLMGEFYEHGSGCPKDAEKSLFFYRKAAECGDFEAQNKMGNNYYYDNDGEEGVSTKSIQDAIYWYTLASNQGYAFSQYTLGYIYYDQKKYEEAFQLVSLAADQGLTMAQFMLATCYQEGLGVKQSLDKSIDWYKKAADRGYTPAMTNYAAFLLTRAAIANGVPDLPGKNVLPESLYWARKAMSLGNETAADLVSEVEGMVSDACGNCKTKNKESTTPKKKFSMCSQCKAVAYCSKECQAADWRKGHKWDCIDKNGVKKTRTATRGTR